MATSRNQTSATEQAPEEKTEGTTEPATAAADTAPADTAPAETAPAPAASASPTPDEFGRLRVRDRDTGHERTIHAGELPHGNYTVLDRRASDRSGDPLPPKHASR